LLPYLEQEQAYKLIAPILSSPPASIGRMDDPENKHPDMPYWFDNPYARSPDEPADSPPVVMFTVGQTRIPSHLCPSGPVHEPDNNAFGKGGPSGFITAGPHVRNLLNSSIFTTGYRFEDYHNVEHLMPLALTHYAGCAGLGVGNNTNVNSLGLPWNSYEGVFVSRNPKKLADLPDGTSSTLMLLEATGRGHSGDPGRGNVYARTWVGSCCVSTGYGTTSGYLVGYDSNSTPIYTKLYEISSYHPGRVNCCFADGSVRSLRSDIPQPADPYNPSTPWLVLQQLGGVRDGAADDSASVFP